MTKNPNCNLYELHNCPHADECDRGGIKIDTYYLHRKIKYDITQIWETIKTTLTPESIIWFDRKLEGFTVSVCQSPNNVETFFERDIRNAIAKALESSRITSENDIPF